MKRPKVRISTLMFLVLIAALTVALIRTQIQLRESEARAEQARAMAQEREARARAQQAFFSQQLAATTPRPSTAKAYGLEDPVFSEIVAMLAKEDLGGVPASEVESDLAEIAEGLPQPIDLNDVTARYVIARREKKESRAEAVKSVRGDLRLKSAVEAIKGAAKK